MAQKPTTLRDRLRSDTTDQHMVLDDLVSGFDLSRPEGLSLYLEMQGIGLTALLAGPLAPETRTIADDLLNRARADLSTLDRHLAGEPAPHEFDPIATSYVLIGSRLGNTILKRRWEDGRAVNPNLPGAYFDAPSHLDQWRAFASFVRTMPAASNRADRAITDANAVFQIYISAAQAVSRRKVPAHV